MVFNNAGIASTGAIDDHSMEEWARAIDIDLWSVIYGCRTFVPMLKEQGNGYIINTASAAGVIAAPQMSSYNVAKAGVVSLSETLRMELAEFNIGVTVVCPTVFVSGLTSSMLHGTGMEKSLADQMAVSKFTSAHVVDAVFRKMRKNKLYVMPQTDAKAAWLIKRLMPETYLKLIAFLYKKRLWVFSGL
jgi:short-subunit dehydrogenase